MEKLLRLVLLIFLQMLALTGFAQNMELQWATKTEGGGNVWTEALDQDLQGNVFTAGYFSGAEDFDHGPNLYLLIAEGNHDAYVAKHDEDGNLIWAFVLGTEEDERVRAMCSDEDGNVYVTGGFSGSLDMDHGTEEHLLTAQNSGTFVAKYDSDGVLQWAEKFSSSGLSTHAYSISLDAERNVYTAGRFTDTTTFRTGLEEETLISNGGSDVFIQKFDNQGEFQWVRQMGGSQNDEAYGITIDESGDIITTGYYTGAIDLDPGPNQDIVTSSGGYDVFVTKMDSDGEHIWARSFGGSSYEEPAEIVSDEEGNIFLTGYFKQSADFDPGPDEYMLTSNGNMDSFVQKLYADGSFAWAVQVGSELADRGNSIMIDQQQQVVSAGQFWGEVDMDPGTGTIQQNSLDVMDIYLLTLDQEGEFISAGQIGGSATEFYPYLNQGQGGSMIIAGTFSGDCDLDPSEDEMIVEASSSYDVFLLKMEEITSGIAEVENQIMAEIYPNPSSGNIQIQLEEKSQELRVRIHDPLGRTTESEILNNIFKHELSLEGPNGIYMIELGNQKGLGSSFRVIKE